MTFEVGLVDLVAGPEGFVQHLAGDQVAVAGLDHGVGTAGRGRLGCHIDDQAGSPIQLNYEPFFKVRGCEHYCSSLLIFSIFRRRPERYAATRGELTPDSQPDRVEQFYQIVADAVDPGLVKFTMHSEGAEIEL